MRGCSEQIQRISERDLGEDGVWKDTEDTQMLRLHRKEIKGKELLSEEKKKKFMSQM